MRNETDERTVAIARSMRLAGIIAARLCHDLAGPLGTIAASLGLAEEDATVAEEARAIASEAANAAVVRLRLLRTAWGAGETPLSIAELRVFGAALPGKGLVVEIGLGSPETIVCAPVARVLLNVLLLAAQSMPAGGHIGVTGDPGCELLITINGPLAAWPEHFAAFVVDTALAWDALSGEGGADMRKIQGPLTALTAQVCAIRLSLLMPIANSAPAPLLMTCAAPGVTATG